MYYDNPYNKPEAFGLTILRTIEWSDEAYQFDMTCVFRNAEGLIGYADDSGCSCPSPFEDLTYAGITFCTREELQAHLEEKDYSRSCGADIVETMGLVVG